MSVLQTHGRPDTGILVLQHQGYDKQGWDIVMRGGQHCIRVIGRMDTEDGLGHWIEDPDSRSDLLGANFWIADFSQRQLSGCAFAWPSEIKSDRSTDVASGVGGGQSRGLGNALAVPKGSGGGPDGRFRPKSVQIPLKTGSPEGDPNALANGAAVGAAQQAANLQQQQANAAAQGLSFLPPAPESRNPNRIDSGSQVLILGIGGSLGGFGGQGVGTGSGFSQFSFGGKSDLSTLSGISNVGRNSSFAKFIGVRTNFSSGSSQAGASFTPVPGGGRGRDSFP